jgi:hypothetical protein
MMHARAVVGSIDRKEEAVGSFVQSLTTTTRNLADLRIGGMYAAELAVDIHSIRVCHHHPSPSIISA